MPDKKLYTLPIPNDAQMSASSSQQRQVAKQGGLAGNLPSTEGVGLKPGSFTISGQYRALYANLMARELEELFDAGDINEVPYFTPSSADAKDGYYTLENVDVSPVKPQEPDFQQFTGNITRVGSQRTHWRAVHSTPDSTVTNDFGSTTTPYVTAPATATMVRWYDEVGKQTEAATVASTTTTEHIDVDLYDASASSFTDPTLIFTVPYTDEGKGDPLVWDDQGHGFANRTDADGIPQWEKVFSTTHNFVGVPVVTNGHVRLYFDFPNNSLAVEEYSAGSWSDVALGTSDWQLTDFEPYRFGVETVEAQVEFEDTSSSGEYRFDMVLHRGWQWPQWLRPVDESNAPEQDLIDLLNSVASSIDTDPQMEQTVVPRSEVRK